MDEKIKVYIKTDERNLVTEINSSIFVDGDGWILLDEGVGDKYAHAQGNYLPASLIDEEGRYNFMFADGKIVILSAEEKERLYPFDPPHPTELELAQQKINELELELIETNQLLTEQELANIETNQHLTELELFIMEGGVSGV